MQLLLDRNSYLILYDCRWSRGIVKTSGLKYFKLQLCADKLFYTNKISTKKKKNAVGYWKFSSDWNQISRNKSNFGIK